MEAARQGIIEPNKTIVCGHWHSSYGDAKIEGEGKEYGKMQIITRFCPNTQKKDKILRFYPKFGAAGRGRTGTVVTPRDFKSLASACSATAAWLKLTNEL